jgi:hypothetical protein
MLLAHRHVVAEVVEAELVVRAVGDVGCVGRPPLLRGHLRLDQTDGDAELSVDGAHPLGVALGQVVVDGDEVHAPPLRELRYAGIVETRVLPSPVFISAMSPSWRRAAHHLDVEVALADRAQAASRTTANASGRRSSRLSPFR